MENSLSNMSLNEEKIHMNRLPVELERDIFEIAASAHPKSIPSIVLVARRTREWLESELYQIVRSGDDGIVYPPLYLPQQNGVHTNTLDLSRIDRFGHHVRHILLQSRPSEEISNILKRCPNVENVALWIIHGPCQKLLPVLDGLTALRRLSFDPSYFFHDYRADAQIPLDQECFRRITHLEIINATSSWHKWEQLACLPVLTHLALAGVVNQQLINRMLRKCPGLEVIVMFYLDKTFLGDDVVIRQKDPRAILLESVTDHLNHWETGARGEDDFWVRAEWAKQDLMAILSESSSSSSSLDCVPVEI